MNDYVAMSDPHGILIGFLNNLISDFDFILDNNFSPLHGRVEIIDSVWQEVREQVLSAINSIETMTPAQLVDELRKAGIPPIQIEWEIEEYDRICQPFNRMATGLKTGERKIGHVGDGLRQTIRPVSRWYNIILGSLSYAFEK
ncbi:hypothetical protein ACFLXT_01920 [Chloroflexota bacterium]